MNVRLDQHKFIQPMLEADARLERLFKSSSLYRVRGAIRKQRAYHQITEKIYRLFLGGSHVSTEAAVVEIDGLILYQFHCPPYRAIFRYDPVSFETFGLAFLEQSDRRNLLRARPRRGRRVLVNWGKRR